MSGDDHRGKDVTCSHASLPEGGVELKKVILGRSHHRGSTGVQVHSPKRTPESYRTTRMSLDLRGAHRALPPEG